MKKNSREYEILSEFLSDEELDYAIKKVESGIHPAYLINRWWFYGNEFKLDSNCLVPQPDTEHIVDKAIKELPENSFFIDIGSGCGCIALSILQHRTDCHAVLFDISKKALDFAVTNADNMHLSDRCEFVTGDMNDAFINFKDYTFDAIISNPPYIKSDIIKDLPDNVQNEPLIALDGGTDGLKYYKVLFNNWSCKLKTEGFFILEIGYDQAEDVTSLADNHDFNCTIIKDYSKNDRVAFCTKKQ